MKPLSRPWRCLNLSVAIFGSPLIPAYSADTWETETSREDTHVRDVCLIAYLACSSLSSSPGRPCGLYMRPPKMIPPPFPAPDGLSVRCGRALSQQSGL